jgi:hypothetical protein
MKRSRESEKLSRLPQILSSKENPARKHSASKLSSQKRMIDITKASIVAASSDKILKESYELEMSETEGLRNAPKTILNLQHKLSIEQKEQVLQ